MSVEDEGAPVDKRSPLTVESQRLVEEATRLYQTDARAHALVETAVKVLNVHNHEVLGQSMSRAEQAVVRMSAALAISLGLANPANIPE